MLVLCWVTTSDATVQAAPCSLLVHFGGVPVARVSEDWAKALWVSPQEGHLFRVSNAPRSF